MTKKEVIERFCQLSTEVGDFFDSQFPYDCFCGKDEIIIKFIEQCVREKMFAIENHPDEIDVQIAKLLLIKGLKNVSLKTFSRIEKTE
jgi:hypothetical protein